MRHSLQMTVRVLWVSAMLIPVTALADAADPWEFQASIYGWFPDISGQTSFSQASGGGDFEVGIDQILDNLKFTLQGTFDVRKGSWGMFADMIYMSVGDSKSNFRDGTIGGVEIPVDANINVDFDMESWIVTAAGYYRVVEQPGTTLDVVAGLRYTEIEQTLDWNITGNIGQLPVPGRMGAGRAAVANWDAIIGVRGRFGFGPDDAWFVPYYLDVGTGDSDLTWQGIAGIGYSFGRIDLAAVWRYLAYDLPSGHPVADMDFNGPEVGVAFRW